MDIVYDITSDTYYADLFVVSCSHNIATGQM